MEEFFEKERGIRPDTLAAFGVRFLDGATSFPYPSGSKHRRHDPDGTRHFWSDPKGVSLGLFEDKGAVGTSTMFLVEGETDTMRLHQELKDEGYQNTVLGLPGVDTWKPEFSESFSKAEIVYVILDNDEDYKVQSRVDNCWHLIRRSLGKKARRIRLPKDAKDVCEFLDKYTIEALQELAATDTNLWHYSSLDLTQEPGPINWLVEDLMAKGDLAIMIGEPGVGKSWISMTLAVAAASGWQTWLGRALNVPTTGVRVLYVDEENPEPLVHYRLRGRLGLTDQAAENIRFLHRQGVRLDRTPQLLLDEVLDWEPELIILDSLTRMHTQDENNAGAIATLFNDGITPLARESGSTVLLLHHVTKTESNSSFARARGSGDISASIDTGLDIRQSDNSGGFNVLLYKSRWTQEDQSLRCRRRDEGDQTIIEADTRRHLF